MDTTYGPKADLAISVTDSPDPVKAGSNLTYTISITNNGPDAAEGVNTGGLPTGTNFVSASSLLGACSSSACNLGTLASGATATATIVVMPVVTGTITYTVKADSSTGDSALGNNTATATTSVTGSADVGVTVSGPATGKINVNVTYTAVITNHGP